MVKDDTQQRRHGSGWALPASLGIHLLGGALLLFGLPQFHHRPEKEQAIKVDLVAPPKPPEKAAPKPPPPAKPPEKKPAPEKPPAADGKAPVHVPIPVLRPVFHFGEKDSGPRKSPDGTTEKDASKARPAADKAVGQGIAGGEAAPRLREAKRLYSQTADADPAAATAMRNIPRDARIGRLCATELRAQLLNASPPYFPQLLPYFRLKEGTVMNAPQAAFQADGRWYEISFRCEVDAEAKKVVSFAFRVGRHIPRSEWKKLGLPSQ